MYKKVVLVTGGFDPLHSGHIEYFKEAKKLGDKLIVGLNSDEWLTRKKGKPFMNFDERSSIVKELGVVDDVISFNDKDDTACAAIFYVLSTHSGEVVFANGGDRNNETTPEMKAFKGVGGVTFEFGVGGEDKKNSSNWILKNWSQPTVERAWGRYTVLEKGEGWLTKKLEFDVGKSLSDHRHKNRKEHWHIVEGNLEVKFEYLNGYIGKKNFKTGDSFDIPKGVWHKATNVGDKPARVIEVWLGGELNEDDIERRD